MHYAQFDEPLKRLHPGIGIQCTHINTFSFVVAEVFGVRQWRKKPTGSGRRYAVEVPWDFQEANRKAKKKTVRDIDQHSIEATKNKKLWTQIVFSKFLLCPSPRPSHRLSFEGFCSASCTARCVMIDLFFFSLQSISHFGGFCIIWISFLVNVSHHRATLGAAGGFYQWEGNFSFTSNPLSKGEPSYVSASMCVNA